ncbi:MAG: class I SAM-dependent methyltransferase [Actinomycetota bacterium]|nr:class I SAM-dependent methyltransferase [Actinomycetota bacterium]
MGPVGSGIRGRGAQGLARTFELGLWRIPEAELRLLEGVKTAGDAIELGCGTAAISAWLSRLGFRPIGVDISRTQLETAAQLERDFGLSFGLLRANAEKLHFDGGRFDLVISEYGASLWCDSRRWLAEAHRVLRDDGRLIFITNSPVLMACTPRDGGPAEDRLVRDYFDTHLVEFPGDGAVELHLTHGEWVHLLHATGFVLENLIEVQAPFGAKAGYDFASHEWAKRWPSEDIWIVHKAR